MDNTSTDSHVLQDHSATGRVRPWREHKESAQILHHAYANIDPSKSKRLAECASRLVFKRAENGGLKLTEASFCRVRLCPMCTWRRSLKISAQMHQIMGAIKQDQELAYILVTLTQQSVEPAALKGEISNVLHAFSKLTRRRPFLSAVKGYYRAMEVTHNLRKNTYHPHIHAVFAVNKSYFASRNYVSQAEWARLWRECLRLDYQPIVDVRKVKGDTADAVAEVAKYAVKPSDYIIPDDWDLTIETIKLLDDALDRRRFVSFGGVFGEYHRRLHLDDIEDGDLTDIGHDDDQLEPIKKDEGIAFIWWSGYRQYLRA